ncbi:TetR/AcrR family transcriptional regulator [Streptococcus sp.]|uniref:TetR/AcrR family transcriptional regulator n=1 Tax=Streptococcus sp. TaxID=1306 RepID=UPI00359F67D8
MVTKKDQILDTSLQLFMKKGFDATSISDILSQLDIARGTLYYHFESKEAIMDAIIERLLNQVLEKIEKLMTNDSLSQAEKFMGFFASINLTQLTGDEEIVDYFNQPQNALFHEKSNRLLIKKLSPVLAQIISEGMESGLFDTPFPAETAELILVGITGFVDSKDSPADEDNMNHRMESFLYNAARMLGMSQSGLDGFKKLFLSK